MPTRATRRFTRTRWTLTVLAVVCMAVWVATGWVAATWNTGRGMVISVDEGMAWIAVESDHPFNVAPTTGITYSKIGPDWNLNLSAGDPIWNNFYVACPLIVPALVFGVPALWMWYRRWKPFDRPERPNRSQQFVILRWGFTALTSLVVMIASASYWYAAEYTRTNGDDVWRIQRGELDWIDHPGSVFDVFVEQEIGFNLTRLPREWEKSVPSPVHWSGTLVNVNAGHSLGFASADLSLWFLAFLLALPTALLWFIRLRRYPPGRCAKCQYDLSGLSAAPGTPCPECGTARQ